MRLRVAGTDDAAAMAITHAAAFDSGWSPKDIAALMNGMGGFAFLAAPNEEGCPGGFVIARSLGGEAEILTLAVEPTQRRRGIARALVEAVVLRAEGFGAGAVFLEVAADNAAAIALYGAAGFAEVGLRRGYYRRSNGRAADALVMRRALNS